jgi:hypothetical protein
MSKKVSFKQKHVAGPPQGQSWVWHAADMRITEKWRKMTLMCHRLLDRIELEHMAHNGLENGRLRISYSQFEEWGISRRSIPVAIKYAVDAGFLDVPKRGYLIKDTTNEYRLTYFATRERVRAADEWSAPTNEWKRRGGKSFFSRAECDTDLGQNVTLTAVAQTPKTAETLEGLLGQNMTHTSISSARGAPAVGAPAVSSHSSPPPSPGRPRQKPPPWDELEKLAETANSTEDGDIRERRATKARIAGGRR